MRMTRFACSVAVLALLAVPGFGQGARGRGNGNGNGNSDTNGDDNQGNNGVCAGLPTAADLKADLIAAPGLADATIGNGMIGGLFNGARMWAAVVNRDGRLCAFATSTDDATQVWPGSQAIAKAKAYTANAFSLDTLPLSTANLYTLTQPGHSLWSLGQSNSFDPGFLAPPSGAGGGQNQITGGLIFFGGGVPLYKGGKIIGGLGVSGDTSCADHEVSKRVRHIATMDPPVVGVSGPAGPKADDIQYKATEGDSAFTHPPCQNTWRNGTSLGINENPATGY